jgi:uncharacterized membrane protein
MPGLDQIFSHVCGQIHCWAPGGKLLPFCQRCTGLYVGGALALMLYGLFRPRPTSLVLWIHGLLLLLMVPFGFHLFPQNGAIRTVTGQLFAFGLIYYLALNPAVQLGVWRKNDRGSFLAYGFGALAAIAALQLAVHLGGTATGAALACIGFIGLLVYTTLAIGNLLVLPPTIWRLFRGARSPASI